MHINWRISVFAISMHLPGHFTLRFECVKETDLILIHSNQLNYTELDNIQIARLNTSGMVPIYTHMQHTYRLTKYSFKR